MNYCMIKYNKEMHRYGKIYSLVKCGYICYIRSWLGVCGALISGVRRNDLSELVIFRTFKLLSYFCLVYLTTSLSWCCIKRR